MVFVSSVLMFNNWWQIDKGSILLYKINWQKLHLAIFIAWQLEAQFLFSLASRLSVF